MQRLSTKGEHKRTTGLGPGSGLVASPPKARLQATKLVPLSHQGRKAIVATVVTWLLFVTVGAAVYGEGTVWFLNLSLWVLALVLLAPVVMIRKGGGLLHPVTFTCLWALVMGVIRQTPMYVTGLQEHRALPGVDAKQLSVLMGYSNLLASLGFLCFMVGFFIAPKIRVPRLRAGTLRGLPWKIGFLACVSIGSLLVWSRIVGGLSGMLLFRAIDRDERYTEVTGAHWQVLADVLWLGALVWLAARPEAIKRVTFWSVVSISLVTVYLMTGSRSGAIFPLIMILLLHTANTQRIPTMRFVFVGVAAIVIIGLLGEFRKSHYGAEWVDLDRLKSKSVSGSLEAGVQELVSRATTGRTDIVILANVKEGSDLLMGRSYLAMPLAIFPSIVLPFDKPPTSGKLVVSKFYGGNFAIPVSSIIEAYWNFHIPGVVVVMMAWGVLLSFATRMYLVNPRVAGVKAMYIVTLFLADFNGTAWAPWVQSTALLAFISVLFLGWPRVQEWVSPKSGAWRFG